MKKLSLLAVVVACLSGCASGFIRESDKLQALEFTEGDKGPTPKDLSVERVLKADGTTLDHVRVIADVSKYTVMILCTPEDSPVEGRRRVVVQRGKHGVFQIPAKYLLDYDLTHAFFVDPWDLKHPLTPTTFSEITDAPSPSWHGVACVVNHKGEGRLLCLVDALPAGPRRKQHQAHATGAPDTPDVASEHRLVAADVAAK